MPHLDFREALSTPEEKLFTPAVSGPATPRKELSTHRVRDLLRGVGLSRPTWTNIVFVAIASVGGIVCAFYFFNGAELLRAAASWPSEYLYPRPLFGDRIAAGASQQLNAGDQSGATNETASTKTNPTKSLSENNPVPAELAPFNNTIPPTTPPDVTQPPPIITILPPPVPPPPTSLLDQLTNDVNTVVGGADSLVQTLYQGATSDHPVTATVRNTKDTIKTTKRKASGAKQKVVATARSATSTARNLQQTATSQTQMSMNTVRPVNQMMSSGGMGGIGGAGAIGGVGTGVGTGAGAGAGVGSVGGVGGLGGLGGLNGGGLGGGISGGGLGGLPGGLPGGHH
jgi:hypothetical protein